MKRLLALAALITAQLALLASPTMPWLKNARGPSGGAGGGGPDAWYDVEIVANANAQTNIAADQRFWASATVGQAGTATKMRFYALEVGGTIGVKAGLYNGTSKIAEGTGSFSSNGVVEVTFDTPVSVSAAAYTIYIVVDSAFAVQYNNATGTLNYDTTTGSYASGPPSTLPSGSTVGWNVCFGVYVD